MLAPHTAVTDAHSISHLNALCSSDMTAKLLLIYNYCQDRCYFNVVVFLILTISQRNIHHISSFSGRDLTKFLNRIWEMCFLATFTAGKAQIAFPPKCPSPQSLKNQCVYSRSGSGCLNLLSTGWSRLLTNLSSDAAPRRCAISCFPSWLKECLYECHFSCIIRVPLLSACPSEVYVCVFLYLIMQGKHFFQIIISMYCAGVHCGVTAWHPRISRLFSRGWNWHSIRNHNVLYDYKKNKRDRHISCLGCMLSIEFQFSWIKQHLSDVWKPDYL